MSRRKPIALAVLGAPSEETSERKDAQRNRERILAAARKLLAQKPINEICMDALAVEAGVGKGTLYRRFKDRSSLCMALLDDASKHLQDATIAGFGLAKQTPPEHRLSVFVTALVRFTIDNAALLSDANAHARDQASRFQHPARTW